MERQIDKSCAVSREHNPLDDILGFAYPVLDHGFVRVVDFMGTDQAIVDSARVSYGKGTEKISTNQGLINYLMGHSHTTPFEMCEIKFHIKLPVFVARQWIRHRTANVNEYSARYSILDKEFYIPDLEVLSKQSQTNNQGRGEALEVELGTQAMKLIIENSEESYSDYEMLYKDGQYEDPEGYKLDGLGVAREISRMVLPTNIYTQFYWKIDLHNLFHFLKLRMDSHAQYEIRVYADQMAKMVEMWVPQAFKAFVNHNLEAKKFSQAEMLALHNLLGMHLNLDYIDQEEFNQYTANFGLSKRESTEFIKKVGFKI